MIELVFPLRWPRGLPKRSVMPVPSAFRIQPSQALDSLEDEIGRAGGTHAVLTTNLPVKQDGSGFYKGQISSAHPEPGVAVYFTRKGKQVVFAVDRYGYPWENWRAIALSIEAMRALERHGGPQVMDAAFDGFVALPGPGTEAPRRPWWEVLGLWEGHLTLPPGVLQEVVMIAYRQKSREASAAGDEALQKAINIARDEWRASQQ